MPSFSTLPREPCNLKSTQTVALAMSPLRRTRTAAGSPIQFQTQIKKAAERKVCWQVVRAVWFHHLRSNASFACFDEFPKPGSPQNRPAFSGFLSPTQSFDVQGSGLDPLGFGRGSVAKFPGPRRISSDLNPLPSLRVPLEFLLFQVTAACGPGAIPILARGMREPQRAKTSTGAINRQAPVRPKTTAPRDVPNMCKTCFPRLLQKPQPHGHCTDLSSNVQGDFMFACCWRHPLLHFRSFADVKLEGVSSTYIATRHGYSHPGIANTASPDTSTSIHNIHKTAAPIGQVGHLRCCCHRLCANFCALQFL